MAPTTTYAGEDGLIVLEAESATPQGDWESRTIDGEDGFLWDADRSNYSTIDEDEALTYRFTADEDGEYYAALHSTRVKSTMNDNDRYENGSSGDERTDTGNDIYFGIKDVETGEYVQEPIKLFTGMGDTDRDLRWGTTFDSGGKRQASVELEAGKEYELEIIGRSDGYFLDKVTLNKGSALKDEDAEQSAVAAAPVEETPPAPQEDPEEDDDADPVTPTTPVAEETPDVTPTTTPDETPSEAEPSSAQVDDDSDSDGGGFMGGIFAAIGAVLAAIFSMFGGGGGAAATAGGVASAAGSAQDETLLSDLIPSTGTYDETLPDPQTDEAEDLFID